MKILSYWSIVVFASVLSCLFPGCTVQQGNKTSITRASAYPKVIERAKKNERHFIMYSGLDTFLITSVLVERSKKQFTVHLNRLDSLHRLQMKHPESLSQKHIHLYTQDSASYTLDEPHTIPFSKVVRIELID